jgi:acylphosphatase
LLVEGHVQGVGFRFATIEIASRFPVTGFVRNLPDGNVDIVVEGPENSVQDFWQALRKSRLYRYVSRENPLWSDARGEFADFSVRYF